MYNTFGIVKPVIQITDMGEIRRLTNPTFYISHSQEFEFFSNTSLYIGVDLFFPGEDDLFRYEPLQNLSIGLRQPFLKNKLLLTFWVDDLLNTGNYSRKININGITIKDYLDGDDTSVRFSLLYKFGSAKSKFKFKSKNNEEEERLKDDMMF